MKHHADDDAWIRSLAYDRATQSLEVKVHLAYFGDYLPSLKKSLRKRSRSRAATPMGSNTKVRGSGTKRKVSRVVWVRALQQLAVRIPIPLTLIGVPPGILRVPVI